MNKKNTFTGYNNDNLFRAKKLRREMTRQERHLWYDFLKSYPVKFYRQRPIEKYIVDFFCYHARIVIELDGSQHFTKDGERYDSIRSEVLKKYDLKVLRFSNLDIDRNFRGVCTVIEEVVKGRITSPPPAAVPLP